jgi:hypothetical protein
MHSPTLALFRRRVGRRMWRGHGRPSFAPINQMKGPGPRRMNLAHKRRARGRIEHTLLDGACRRHSNRIKTFARSPSATPPYHEKLQMFLFATKGRGIT